MQQRISRRRASAVARIAQHAQRDRDPVVVLEADHAAAAGLQAQLSACGFEWIALVHDVADARRIIAAAPARLVLLSLEQRATEVLAIAAELAAAGVPLILTSASGGSLVLPGVHEPLTILARGCSREDLAAAYEAQLTRRRR